MDRLMAFLHKMLSWLPRLGGGVKWIWFGKTWYLWPFVALAIFIGLILIYHFGFANA